MKSKDLSRLEWHRLATANLQTYLAELEQFLARTLLPHQRPAAEQLIAEIQRRLAQLEEETGEGR
jgi:hypothetical protein